MQFNLSILGAMLAASSSVLAAPTTPQVESPSAAIQQVVTLSASFQKEIQGFSDPAQIGQAIVSEYQKITKAKDAIIAQFGLSGAAGSSTQLTSLTTAEEDGLCQSLLAFVRIDQELLVTVTAEKQVITDPYGSTTFALLRADAQSTETFVSGFFTYVPNCAENVRPEFQSLQTQYSTAVAAFESF